MQNKRIWLVTGISSGFGKALALQIMQTGDFLIGTLRENKQVQEFNHLYTGQGIAYKLDVTDYNAVKEVMQDIKTNYGRIDVLVNNAGFGLIGAIEAISLDDMKEQMETNFFGSVNMTQQVLSIMRKQGCGFIVQISSIAGFCAAPGSSAYIASKFALEGFSEALAKEVEPLNIKVIIVEPGPSRTNFTNPTSIKIIKRNIKEYSETAGARIKHFQDLHGKQQGDPKKVALAIIHAVNSAANSKDIPLRLPLGNTVVERIRSKIETLNEGLEYWEKDNYITDLMI
jgi:short-subunit dehydrogenase